jgi:hypothetical protein
VSRTHQPDPELKAKAEQYLLDTLSRASTELKREFVMAYILLGDAHGWNLREGDVALVHPEDVPKGIALIRGVDPVWINARMAQPGRCLFVGNSAKNFPLYSEGALNA